MLSTSSSTRTSKSIQSANDRPPSHHPDAQRVEEAFLSDIDDLQPSSEGRILPIFVHVPDSVCEPAGKSQYDPLQRLAALYAVNKITECGIVEKDIMVIGAYRAEIIELRKMMHNKVLVSTADSVQGKERDYVLVIFSTTEASKEGFTKNPNRLCVMLSRGKKGLILVGDLNTVNWQSFDPSGKQDTIYLQRIHKYFSDQDRVTTFKDKQTPELAPLVTNATTPSSANGDDDTPLNEEILEKRIEDLEKQLGVAVAALTGLRADRMAKKSDEQPKDTKPVSLASKLLRFARKPSRAVSTAGSRDVVTGWQSPNNSTTTTSEIQIPTTPLLLGRSQIPPHRPPQNTPPPSLLQMLRSPRRPASSVTTVRERVI